MTFSDICKNYLVFTGYSTNDKSWTPIFEDFKNKINKIVESDRAFEKLIKPFVEAKAEAKNIK